MLKTPCHLFVYRFSHMYTPTHAYEHTYKHITYSHSFTRHGYLYFLCVISLIRLCICNNPANVTAVLLLGLLCILSRAHKHTDTHIHTYIQQQTNINTQISILFHIRWYSRSRSLAHPISFEFPTDLCTHIYLYYILYFHICVYAEYKIPFFSFFLLLFICTLQKNF